MALNKAVILWDNVMRRNSPAYTGAVTSGYDLANAYDWRDFSLFRAAAGNTQINTTLAAEEDIDCAAVWTVARAASATIELQLVSPLTTLATFNVPAGEELLALVSFNEVTVPIGGVLRWQITAGAAALDIRQVAFGKRLVNPIGQYVGQTPPTLLQGVITTNVIAVNGSIIGRNYRRVERSTEIDWDPVDRDWVRSTWEPFAAHAARRSFFYQWAPVSFPSEVVMAGAESIIAPENISPPPKMRVRMPLRCLAKRS